MFDHLCTHGAYSEADAARLIREVASALAFLHGLQTVHGDLKPENLLLSSEKAGSAVVKLVDFGSAQVSVDEDSDETSTRPTASTPAYSPPEFLENKEVGNIDPSFDMWALGVILYIMLTGVHPFDLYGK
jgi:serine/threonine protein kinase